MNFKTRLEALKWMCENVGGEVYCDVDPEKIISDLGTEKCYLDKEGLLNGSIGILLEGSINYRTTPELEPDPKPEPEFEWPKYIGPWDPVARITGQGLVVYTDAILKYLDKRFVRK